MLSVLNWLKEYSYMILFILLLVLSVYLISTEFAYAEDYQVQSTVIQQGDTLWGIAMEHHEDLGMSIQEYIDRVKHINQLDTALIFPGQSLQIMVLDHH